MSAATVYIVDFNDAFCKFHKVISDPNLPTIDADMLKFNVMDIFMQVDPNVHLHRIANEMVRDDVLYGKEDIACEDGTYFLTKDEISEQEKWMRDYLREAILDLGRSMMANLRATGLIRNGSERYSVVNRSITNDTYLFKRIRG